jgi:hypothetical protein
VYLLDLSSSSPSASRPWTPQQAWLLIKQLAVTPTLRYNELLLSDLYKDSGESVLQALEQSELITIVSSNGRPTAVKPGKPVYSAAFKLLTEDRVLRSRLDLAILTQLIGIENKNIEKWETELSVIGGLPKQPGELSARIKWLLLKCQGSQGKVEGYEKESGVLKKVLMAEY